MKEAQEAGNCSVSLPAFFFSFLRSRRSRTRRSGENLQKTFHGLA